MLQISNYTAIFIEDMFPDLWKLIQMLFPDAITCRLNGSYDQIEMGGRLIRNPTLVPFQLFGLFVAIYGLFVTRNNAKSQGYFFGSLFFAGMVISSIFCHNIFEWHSVEWEYARILDLVFTGSSALSLWYTRLIVPTRMYYITFLLLLGYNLRYSFLTSPAPFLPEATYIGTMIIALVALGRRLTQIGRSRFWQFMGLFSNIMMIGCLLGDHYLCIYFGSAFLTTHAMFFGSALALLSLIQLSSESSSKEKQS